VALQFCHEDSRCKAGIDIDGAPHGSVIQAGLRQPFMFLLSDHGDGSDPASIQIGADIQSIYDRIPPDRTPEQVHQRGCDRKVEHVISGRQSSFGK
jgi:hypothetical protein